MSFLTGSIVVCFLELTAFAIVVLYYNWQGIEVQPELIEAFISAIALEFAAPAAIKITKHVIKKKELEEKIKKLKEEGIEIVREDIKNSSTSNSDDLFGDDDDDGSDGIYYG